MVQEVNDFQRKLVIYRVKCFSLLRPVEENKKFEDVQKVNDFCRKLVIYCELLFFFIGQ